MSGLTKIEWADRVWNPITGCTKCSPACDNCYAERMSKRLAGRCGYPALEPFKVTLHEDKLAEPLTWKKPARIFVGSMTDLFHAEVQDAWLDRIFAIMALCPQHTFMLLTKRPERMAEYLERRTPAEWRDTLSRVAGSAYGDDAADFVHNIIEGLEPSDNCANWPLPNVWLGTTIWYQESADRAVPILLSTPAAKRFVSVEPMLGPVDLTGFSFTHPGHYAAGGQINALSGDWWPALGDAEQEGRERLEGPALDWVICGGETGPGARPMHPDWPRSLRDQCQAAVVPFFFKQWGEYRHCGGVGVVETRGSDTPNCAWPDGTVREGTADSRGGAGVLLARVGKAKAGRVLDGRTWEKVPA